jgi:hypothetical protein
MNRQQRRDLLRRGERVFVAVEACDRCGAPICPVCGEECPVCECCGLFNCETCGVYVDEPRYVLN